MKLRVLLPVLAGLHAGCGVLPDVDVSDEPDSEGREDGDGFAESTGSPTAGDHDDATTGAVGPNVLFREDFDGPDGLPPTSPDRPQNSTWTYSSATHIERTNGFLTFTKRCDEAFDLHAYADQLESFPMEGTALRVLLQRRDAAAGARIRVGLNGGTKSVAPGYGVFWANVHSPPSPEDRHLFVMMGASEQEGEGLFLPDTVPRWWVEVRFDVPEIELLACPSGWPDAEGTDCRSERIVWGHELPLGQYVRISTPDCDNERPDFIGVGEIEVLHQ